MRAVNFDRRCMISFLVISAQKNKTLTNMAMIAAAATTVTNLSWKEIFSSVSDIVRRFIGVDGVYDAVTLISFRSTMFRIDPQNFPFNSL